MIDSRELRIGNLILVAGWSNPRQVTLINESQVQAASQAVHFTRIFPIPLTEEWLLKFGFLKCKSPYRDQEAYSIGKDGNTLIWCRDDFYKALPDNAFIRVTTANYPVDKPCVEFVHQLQNGIYFLTGQELEITLPT